MSKIAVMGAYDSIYGFGTLGLDTFPVKEKDEAAELLRRLAGNDYGVIYMTEELAAILKNEIAAYSASIMPAIILIPGIKGNTGAGIEGVKKTVEQAVGSDILFGGTTAKEGDAR